MVTIDRSVAAENVRLSASGATSMAGIVFKMASLVHAVEPAVGFCTLLAGFSADLDDGHIPARRTSNCVLYK